MQCPYVGSHGVCHWTAGVSARDVEPGVVLHTWHTDDAQGRGRTTFVVQTVAALCGEIASCPGMHTCVRMNALQAELEAARRQHAEELRVIRDAVTSSTRYTVRACQ